MELTDEAEASTSTNVREDKKRALKKERQRRYREKHREELQRKRDLRRLKKYDTIVAVLDDDISSSQVLYKTNALKRERDQRYWNRYRENINQRIRELRKKISQVPDEEQGSQTILSVNTIERDSEKNKNTPLRNAEPALKQVRFQDNQIADPSINSINMSPPCSERILHDTQSTDSSQRVHNTNAFIKERDQRYRDRHREKEANLTESKAISHDKQSANFSNLNSVQEILPVLLNVINNTTTGNNIVVNTTRGRQQQRQPDIRNRVIEEILIGSRPNSPVLDTTISATTSSGKSTPRNENVASPFTTRKSYMTMVNPNFESMLGNSSNEQANAGSPMPDKENRTSDGNATPTSPGSMSPEPFEVVFVIDDFSEGEESPAENKIGDSSVRNSDSASPSQQQNQQMTKESNESKSFVRVRSTAELQRMEVYLCAVCGKIFDTFPAFKQHSKAHETGGKSSSTGYKH